ncbi:hypothetical protein VPH159E362A_0045 [Vibrio phage 159E36-2a]
METKLLLIAALLSSPTVQADKFTLDSEVCEYYGTLTLLTLEYKRRGLPFDGLMKFMTTDNVNVAGYEIYVVAASAYNTDSVYLNGSEITIDDDIERNVVNHCMIGRTAE